MHTGPNFSEGVSIGKDSNFEYFHTQEYQENEIYQAIHLAFFGIQRSFLFFKIGESM